MSAGAPAGYYGTPLVRKLGIKPGARLGLIAAPDGFDDTLGELPGGVVVRRRTQGRFDVIVVFCSARSDLERRLPPCKRALDQAGGLWVAWPKRSSGMSTDLGDGAVRELGLAAGLVDNKVCAIDATWSGLRFVYRVADRVSSARSAHDPRPSARHPCAPELVHRPDQGAELPGQVLRVVAVGDEDRRAGPGDERRAAGPDMRPPKRRVDLLGAGS